MSHPTNTPASAFITSRIERQPRYGCAMITVEQCWFEDGGPVRRRILQQYETASRGASESARKAVAKAKAAETQP